MCGCVMLITAQSIPHLDAYTYGLELLEMGGREALVELAHHSLLFSCNAYER